MATNQEGRQAACRDSTGKALDYTGDWHALFDAKGIDAGTHNERLLLWINGQLSSTYASVQDAMQAYAESQGFINWSSMNTFTPT